MYQIIVVFKYSQGFSPPVVVNAHPVNTTHTCTHFTNKLTECISSSSLAEDKLL